ncbi:MAG: hypothetical protein A2W31_09920 [Planctomycetes bacterium RBG_16_64_10]|nr:MAG: hypothetical protein A2W31_09920 [Planctomycetes bacterium RBG_16_64_10]
MHVRDTVQLAALVATCGRQIVRDCRQLSTTSLNDYYLASKRRLGRWARAVRGYERQHQYRPAPAAQAGWLSLVPVLEEILAGAALVRVWTAVVTAHDRRHGQQDNERLVQRVFLDHEAARNRAMRHMLAHPLRTGPVGLGCECSAVAGLEQCRRRTERWTDLLIGFLVLEFDVARFAFEPDRARDFARDMAHMERVGAGDQAWSLTVESLRAAFPRPTSGSCPNPDLNEQIAASILACFAPEVFDSIGPLQSLWTVRLLAHADDAAGMIDDLLRL